MLYKWVRQILPSQVGQLCTVGYPELLVFLIERIHRKIKAHRAKTDQVVGRDAHRHDTVVVFPYMYCISHPLEKLGQHLCVQVVFGPALVVKMTKGSFPVKTGKYECNVKHHTKYVDCVSGVIYKILVSCGARYVGQSGRSQVQQNSLFGEFFVVYIPLKQCAVLLYCA